MCEHFQAIVPVDWKAEDGWHSYDRYDVRQEICKTKLHQKGICALEPVHREVSTNHFCGHFVRIAWSNHEANLAHFIWGDDQTQQVARLERQVQELKRQLKSARARSHKRLQQLQSKQAVVADAAVAMVAK